MSEKQYRDKIAAIKKQQATEEAMLAKARAAAAKYRSEASKELNKITPRTSVSMAQSYRRSAESAEKKAQAEDSRIKNHSSKLGNLAKDLATAETNLDREVRATARRAEQEANQRRARERRHAQEIARLSSSTVHYIHEVRSVPMPKPEVLRVLYLTANAEMDLRTEVEVRDVQQAVRRATHRDLIEITYRPAATPEDLLDGLNDMRPHVVHFSGHAGGAAIVFDNASIDTPEGRDVTFDLLERVLSATSSPPSLLILNGCDTLDGAETLLDSTPVVVAMASEISDLAASVFAARFYSAIASAQPVGPAVRQAAVALDLVGLDEGWKPTVCARDDLDLEQLMLVQPTPE